MTEYQMVFGTIILILTIATSVATWLLKTSRQFMHDFNDLLKVYNEAKSDKKLTHAEKDAILKALETLLLNVSANTKLLLQLRF